MPSLPLKQFPTDKRLAWVDYAKGMAILLVVYRHVFEGIKRTPAISAAGVEVSSYLFLEHLNIFFFSFRMPLFFLVSGAFIGSSLRKRGWRRFVANKTKTILYPYFLWGFIQISIQIAFSAFINSKKSIGDYGYLFYQPREVEQFWYLLALFNVSVLFALAKSRWKLASWLQIGLGGVLFFISALFSQFHMEWGFVSDIFHYYVFFAIGDSLEHWFRRENVKKLLGSWPAFFTLLPPFVLCQAYFLTTNLAHKVLSPKYLYVEYDQPVIYLIVSLIGCGFLICLSSLLDRYRSARWLPYVGKHSLYIYVLHVIVFAAVRVFITRVLHIYEVYSLLTACVVCGLLVPILVFKLTQSLGWGFLFSLEKPRLENKKPFPSSLQNQPIVYEN